MMPLSLILGFYLLLSGSLSRRSGWSLLSVVDVAVVEDGVLLAVVRVAFEKTRAVVVVVDAVADVGVKSSYCQDRFREDQGCR